MASLLPLPCMPVNSCPALHLSKNTDLRDSFTHAEAGKSQIYVGNPMASETCRNNSKQTELRRNCKPNAPPLRQSRGYSAGRGALTCGLVTAFPGGRSGAIWLSVKRTGTTTTKIPTGVLERYTVSFFRLDPAHSINQSSSRSLWKRQAFPRRTTGIWCPLARR